MRTSKLIPSVLRCYQTVVISLMVSETFSQDELYPVQTKGQPWTPPSDEADYLTARIEAKYLGLLIAGFSEFNWIVDVRVRNESPGYRSIGNLVSYYHVLTPCRFARTVIEKRAASFRYVPDTDYRWGIYDTSSLDIKVRYCENYLYSDPQLPGTQDWGHSGERAVDGIVIHPNCFTETLLYDAAVMLMTVGISAIVPMVGYMPVNIDYTLEKIKDTGADYLQETSLCYVASYGRGYVNLPKPDNAVSGTKVKYRVYSEKWEVCNSVFSFICTGHEHQQCDITFTYPHFQNMEPPRSILCFSTRAKVGTVCDHDRGAPVVCNGDVIGMVIRGANESHCNNMFHIPFIALKIDGFKVFLEQTVDYLHRPLSKYSPLVIRKDDPSAGHRAVLVKNMPLMMMSIAIFSMTQYLHT